MKEHTPDKPGWWWWQENKDSRVFVVEVWNRFGELAFIAPRWEQEIFVSDKLGLWLAPCHAPGESFTVEEIKAWMEAVAEHISYTDPQHGIKTFTERNRK